MNRSLWLKMFAAAAVSIALTALPETSLAQRGGFHGGGSGGFHGGGFGGGFRGAGGFHGGNFGGNRGGFGGFHGDGFGGGFVDGGFGRFRGGDRFFFGGGYPWFFGFNFGFDSFWYGYPYLNGYAPWWGGYYEPYSYPDYRYYPPDTGYTPDYRHEQKDKRDDRTPNDSKPNNSRPDDRAPSGKPSGAGAQGPSDPDYMTVKYALVLTDSANGVPAGLRPPVRNAVALLKAMPPEARQRWLNSGRYDNFSAEEREILSQAVQVARAE